MNTLRPLIIIGMHRSGTSLTASLLQRSGLDLGKSLMGSGVGNTKGHYENMDFYHFHMKVLKQSGYDTSGWDEIEINTLNAELEKEARGIIDENKSALWGWKDPRTTLFVKFWAELLPDARFLFIYRAPAEVIDSFYRRGVDELIMEQPEKAADLWLHYNKLVLKYYNEYKDRSLLIPVQSFIQAYPDCIHLINEKFNLNLNSQITHLYDHTLYKDSSDDLLKAQQLYALRPEVQQIYQQLIQQSWHPKGMTFEKDELRKNNPQQLPHKDFFIHWKKQYDNDRRLKKSIFRRIREVWRKLKSLL